MKFVRSWITEILASLLVVMPCVMPGVQVDEDAPPLPFVSDGPPRYPLAYSICSDAQHPRGLRHRVTLRCPVVSLSHALGHGPIMPTSCPPYRGILDH